MQRRVAVAGRLLEAFVFAPIGAGAKLVTDGPEVVARARQELSNARFIGEMVVGQGTAQLKERLAHLSSVEPVVASPAERIQAEADGASDEPTVDAPTPEAAVDVPTRDAAVDVPTEDTDSSVDVTADVTVDVTHGDVVDSGELAVPDYDSLPAIDIVGQLDSLTSDELRAVESYERANRRRRTVLGKIAQLTDPA